MTDERSHDGTSPPPGADDIVLAPPPPHMLVHWATPAGPPPGAFVPPPGAFPPPPQKPAKPSRLRAALRRGVLVAALVGLAVGMVGGAVVGAVAADDQPRVDRLSAEVSGLEQDLTDAEDRRRADVEAARRETEAALADDIAQQQEELDARAEELDARKTDLDSREAGLDEREGELTVLEEQAADGSIPGDGLYLVGSEVEPGTYRASDGAGCYWERLSGASGDFGDLITNGFGAGDSTVTIQGSDYAFSSEGCGGWTRLD